jgi:hypothetical protein
VNIAPDTPTSWPLRRDDTQSGAGPLQAAALQPQAMDLPAPSWTNLSRLISAMLLDDLRQYPNVPDLNADRPSTASASSSAGSDRSRRLALAGPREHPHHRDAGAGRAGRRRCSKLLTVRRHALVERTRRCWKQPGWTCGEPCGDFGFSERCWRLMLALGRHYGWRPEGTLPPDSDWFEDWCGDCASWDGRYYPPEGNG